MLSRWFEGHVLAEFMMNENGRPFPLEVIFRNNGVMSVTVGNEVYRPSSDDLEKVATWAQGVAKAMQIPDEQVFVGAYRCLVE